MRLSYMLIISLIFLLNAEAYGSLSFNCKKAITRIEKVICKHTLLCDLDRAINIVYKKALALYSNSTVIKSKQLEWMNSRKEEYEALVDAYTKRLLELLNNHNLRTYFLNKFLDDHLSVEPIIVYIAAISLWEDTSSELDWYDLIDQLIQGSKYIPINKNEALLALMTSQGAYQKSYSFFILRREKESISIEPFFLPCTKTFKLPVEGERGNTLSGNFTFKKTEEQTFIDYSSRASSYEGGVQCTWQIDHNGAKVIKERIP